jgi:HD-like signal output (HDOD) protein
MNAPTVLPLDRDHCIDQVQALPSLPAVVVQLMALLQQQDVNLEPIAETLSLDQALSAKVLQLANSPFYGVSGRITSIRDGINILGLRPLSTLVLAAVLTVQFDQMHGKALHLEEFWCHSIACAVASRALAQEQGLDEGSAFTAGLLHDVGLLVLDSLYPVEMAQALQWAVDHDAPHLQAEQALLGVSRGGGGLAGSALALCARGGGSHCRAPQPSRLCPAQPHGPGTRGQRPGACPGSGWCGP